jgi:hypothetical protein
VDGETLRETADGVRGFLAQAAAVELRQAREAAAAVLRQAAREAALLPAAFASLRSWQASNQRASAPLAELVQALASGAKALRCAGGAAVDDNDTLRRRVVALVEACPEWAACEQAVGGTGEIVVRLARGGDGVALRARLVAAAREAAAAARAAAAPPAEGGAEAE